MSTDDPVRGAVIRTSEFGWAIEVSVSGVVMRHVSGDGHTSPWISCKACNTARKVEVVEMAEQGWKVEDA